MSEGRPNKHFSQALAADNTLGTPLFDQEERRPVPPEFTRTPDTQLEAWKKMRESGALHAQQLRILWVLKRHGPLAAFQIVEKTGIAMHVVSGRVNELRTALGEIEFAITKENPNGKILNPTTGYRVNLYRIKEYPTSNA